MPKTKTRRVKGSASRGRGKKWILILLVVLLLIPAMQVAVVRFINPPRTLPMLIDQSLLKRTKGSAPLSLDRSAADSRDVPEAPLDFGRSAVLPARWL